MKNATSRQLAARALLATVMGLASAASMAAATYSMGSGGTSTTGGTNGLGNQRVFTGSDGITMTVTAYGSNSSNPSAYSAGWVGQFGGGLGVGSQLEGGNTVTSNEHTLDNNPLNGLSDILILKFSSAVALSSIGVGFVSGDADMTIAAYTGGVDLNLAGGIAGKSSAAAVTAMSGWQAVQHIGDGGSPQTTESASSSSPLVRNVNASNVTSSWWLISAYNSGFGGTAIANADTIADFVKVLNVSTKTVPQIGKLPEPTSLALAGLALVGVVGVSRRSKKSA